MSAAKGHKETLITNPGPRLKKYIPLNFVKSHGGNKKSTYAELNLTSMVDMLTILVVFLLQTFSASGELLSVQRNIVLPEAHNFKDLEQAPIIAVAADAVTLNGEMEADANDLNQQNTSDWKITKLHDDLVTLKNNYKLLHPSDTTGYNTVIVQADRNIDFKVLKKVMFSCSLAGYSNVNFAIQVKGKSSG